MSENGCCFKLISVRPDSADRYTAPDPVPSSRRETQSPYSDMKASSSVFVITILSEIAIRQPLSYALRCMVSFNAHSRLLSLCCDHLHLTDDGNEVGRNEIIAQGHAATRMRGSNGKVKRNGIKK